jgi:hypothetical protein
MEHGADEHGARAQNAIATQSWGGAEEAAV